jgi:TonB family protein
MQELARQQEAQRTQELARQQEMQRRAEELALQQEGQRRAEEAARQQEVRRQAEELTRQQADRLARELADQAARRAAQAAAAQRNGDSELAAGNSPTAGGAGTAGGSGGNASGTPGSDLASRSRDMVRGLDILKGAPPVAPARPGERRLVDHGAEREVALRMYVDSIRQKIERNGTLNHAQLGADRVRIDPLVSVTLRSDGSVDDVTILRSSGRPDIDEAVRRVVQMNARYSVFPPNVAANYDVVEIRRIWSFAGGLKLMEEVR